MYHAGPNLLVLEMCTRSRSESAKQKRLRAQYLREVHHVERWGARREVREVDGHARHVDVVVAEAVQQEEDLGAQAVEDWPAPAHLQWTRTALVTTQSVYEFGFG